MLLAFVHRSRLPGAGAAIAVLLSAPLAWGAIGAGSLYVASSPSQNPTHWDIPIGVPVVAEIRGVLASEVGGSFPPTITVIVKSSDFGNTFLTATRIGMTADYTFTYTAPAVANGDPFDACNTTIVAYVENGQNSNNDLIDDGQQNGSSNAACGFRFLNAAGQTIPCGPVGVEPRPWSSVKALYRE
jgi:hypothetical protein